MLAGSSGHAVQSVSSSEGFSKRIKKYERIDKQNNYVIYNY